MKTQTNTVVVGIFAAVLGTGFSACSPMTSTRVSDSAAKDALTSPIKFQVPECEVMRPDYQVNTQVVSFEMKDKFGINFGFTNPTGFSAGVHLNLKQASLTVGMTAVNPLDPSALEGAVVNQNNQNTFDASFDFSFSMITINPSYAYTTPLAKTTMGAMTKGLSSLEKAITNKSPWEAHILEVLSPTQIMINSGSNAGIQIGDQFAVYNVTNHWMGAPCASKFLMETTDTAQPIAIVTATQISGPRAVLESSEIVAQVMKQGGIVRVAQLNTGTAKSPVKRAALKKQISVGGIESPLLTFTDASVNLVDFFKYQFDAAIFSSNFALSE